MNIPPALRLALVPIGIAIAHKGLQYLTDESDRLAAEVDARRAELVASYTAKGWIFPACEHRPDTTREAFTPCPDCPAPEDLPPAPASSTPAAGEPAAPARARTRVRGIVANAAAFGLGAYLAMRAQAWLQQRAAAELATDAEQVPTLHCRDCRKPFPGTSTFPGPRCVDCYLGPDEPAPAPTPEQVWDTYADPAPTAEQE